MFQFHIGAIKIASVKGGYTALTLFQFHIGAIKIAECADFKRYQHAFQFHIGAIKITATSGNTHSHRGFNSILVRLK